MSENSNFIKYFSIPNSYNDKVINYWLKKCPELKTELFILQHKYDGSNFQIMFSKEKPIQFASRNQLLDKNSKFFGYQNLLPSLKHIFDKIQTFLNESNFKTINLFGELYGKSVINRINYETDSMLYLKFFDVFFDQKLQTPKNFYDWVKKVEIPDVNLVEIYGEPDLIENCLKFDTSVIKTKCNDIIEGVVIKPYNFDLIAYFEMSKEKFDVENDDENENNISFYVKLKNREFLEVECKPKEPVKPSADKSNIEMTETQRLFDGYINENRVLNSFGKQAFGKKDTSKLADFVINDALNDFIIDIEMNKFPEINFQLEEIKKLDLKNKAIKLNLPSKISRQKLFMIIKSSCKF